MNTYTGKTYSTNLYSCCAVVGEYVDRFTIIFKYFGKQATM